ncbi:hypothetical protein [Streptomyces sp. NPDC005538]|uniref:hypothetical protein n=1 Tax=Streptomyces sp. NPDC005538 TaxID=3157043 RepID=UPI0033A780FC
MKRASSQNPGRSWSGTCAGVSQVWPLEGGFGDRLRRYDDFVMGGAPFLRRDIVHILHRLEQ